MDQTKITVSIWEALLASFNRDIDRLCLKRDAFMNRMIAIETEHLAEDLKGKRLSSRAKRYISGDLKRLGTRPVNIVVDKAVASALNAVVDETNIVRDAFINRMIWLLTAEDWRLNELDLPRFILVSEFESSIPEAMPTAPLVAMAAIQQDPLYYLRVGCEDRHKVGLYLLDLPVGLAGLECWLPDLSVPGTPSYVSPEDLLAELEAVETDAFRDFAPARRAGAGRKS